MNDSASKTHAAFDFPLSGWAGKCVILQAVSTLYMVGVIWFVQVVHYPMFAMVGPEQFAKWEQRNVVLTTWVVGPGMLVEAITTLGLFFIPRQFVSRKVAAKGAILLGVIWLSTHFLQVPCHDKLATGFDPEAHQSLVQSNWLRTVAWSMRGLLVIGLLSQAFALRDYREPK
ncbi:MAG: hypothetical protein JNM43_18750 [Planctomycetaceae bacterium]|nr:hypothetical protein [Planctomycetaceae bacterium]